MKDLPLIFLILCFGFISNIDIEFDEETGIFNFTSGETYNFYIQVEQLSEIQINFIFEDFTYLPFNCAYINEYSSRNGTSIRNKTIEDLEYKNNNNYHYYYFSYSLEDFSSIYISLTVTPNITIDNVKIEIYFYGGLNYISNGERTNFLDNEGPLYLAIPAIFGSNIFVELTMVQHGLTTINLIEYQKNNSGCFIHVNKNYTSEYSIINLNYIIQNTNTNFLCVKILYQDDNQFDVYATLTESKYYFTLYDKNSLDVFDLKTDNDYSFYLKAKYNQLINISYTMVGKDIKDDNLPINKMIVYEKTEEFDLDFLKKLTYSIKTLSESFIYVVSKPETNYLSLTVNPLFNFEKFNIAYNIIEITTSYKLENNTLLSLSDLYHDISYYLNISSKNLDASKYEITIKDTALSSAPFNKMYFIEYPSNKNHSETVNFKQVGKDLKYSSYFRASCINTRQASFKIISETNIKSMSIKVNIEEANKYYLTKEVKENIGHIISNKDYFFIIDLSQNNDKKNISVNIEFISNSGYEPNYSIYYYMGTKEEYELEQENKNYVKFEKEDKKFSGTIKYEFNFDDINKKNLKFLLINANFESDLDDFKIQYEYLETKSGSSKILLYVLTPLAAVVALISLIIIIRQCRKKNANSNAIADTSDSNANLLPK